MKFPGPVEKYGKKFSFPDCPAVGSGRDGIEQVVVIPALAEKNSLFATLASLSRNPPRELQRTLVLCVVNNRGSHLTTDADRRDNQETLSYLQALVRDMPAARTEDGGLVAALREISHSPLRIAYIDAASPGREMPDKEGGVGAARKIGLDAALQVFDYDRPGARLLISLDADTLVEANYLEAIRSFFVRGKTAAVVNYTHQPPAEARQRLAIGAYELFLRYYVLGLRYAGSPYAFPTIGSTMVCTAEAYAAIGGMNRREAAEDFYFLNKLAKYGEIGKIKTTTVYPSARPSRRVPFGTGRKMVRFLEGAEDEFLLYDPRVFLILKSWLDMMKSSPDRTVAEIGTRARKIDPRLFSFLEGQRFFPAWERIRNNSKGGAALLRHFHFWFDGFQTLKLIHYLTEQGLPRICMFCALEELLRLMGRQPGEGGLPPALIEAEGRCR